MILICVYFSKVFEYFFHHCVTVRMQIDLQQEDLGISCHVGKNLPS